MASAADVKRLREHSGAGFLSCRDALVEAKGDFEAAVDVLRLKGLASAAAKSGRASAEGVIAIAGDEKAKVAIELNSETDFVSRNDDFINLAKRLADRALEVIKSGVADQQQLDSIAGGEDQELAARLGENIRLRRGYKLAAAGDGIVVGYLHGRVAEGVGRIATLVALDSDEDTLGREVAMQVAAQNPLWLSRERIPADKLEHERDILRQQIEDDSSSSSKPAEIIEKMLIGRMNKFFTEHCLLEQTSIIDSSMSVTKRLADKTKVVDFVRFEVGAGLEKRVQDFASEVAAQVRSS